MTAAAGSLMGWRKPAKASEAKPLIVRDAKIIHVRERNKGSGVISYLEIASESGIKGYAGPLLAEQVSAFPLNLASCWQGVTLPIPKNLTSPRCGPRATRANRSPATPMERTRSQWLLGPDPATLSNRMTVHRVSQASEPTGAKKGGCRFSAVATTGCRRLN